MSSLASSSSATLNESVQSTGTTGAEQKSLNEEKSQSLESPQAPTVSDEADEVRVSEPRIEAPHTEGATRSREQRRDSDRRWAQLVDPDTLSIAGLTIVTFAASAGAVYLFYEAVSDLKGP